MQDQQVIEIVRTWPDNIKVDAATREHKYAICQSCDYFEPTNKICLTCKCEMNLLTWSKSMGTCPKGKFRGEPL